MRTERQEGRVEVIERVENTLRVAYLYEDLPNRIRVILDEFKLPHCKVCGNRPDTDEFGCNFGQGDDHINAASESVRRKELAELAEGDESVDSIMRNELSKEEN